MLLKIVDIERVSECKWNAFIYNQECGNIFQTPEMYKIFSRSNIPSIGVAALNERGDIEGILIGFVNRYLNLFSRTVVYGGPIIDAPEIIPELLGEFSNKVHRYSRVPVMLDIRNTWETSLYKILFEKSNYVFEEHLNYIIPLDTSIDNVWYRISINRRSSISRGLSRFTVKEVETEQDIETAYSLIISTYRRVKVPSPSKRLFVNAYEILRPKGYIKWLLAWKGEVAVATLIILTYKRIVYGWYIGSLYTKNANYSNELLVWQALKFGAENGYKFFDFGGAGNPKKRYGPREFKRSFGGIEVNWGIYRKICSPLFWRFLRPIAKLRYSGISQQVD